MLTKVHLALVQVSSRRQLRELHRAALHFRPPHHVPRRTSRPTSRITSHVLACDDPALPRPRLADKLSRIELLRFLFKIVPSFGVMFDVLNCVDSNFCDILCGFNFPFKSFSSNVVQCSTSNLF